MKERRLPIILISLVFAVLLWASVNLGNEFITSVTVPIRIDNIAHNKAIAEPLPDSIRFTIRASGWELLKTLLTPDLHYTIDLSASRRPVHLFTVKDLQGHVQIPEGVVVVTVDPETVRVVLDDRIERRFAVVPDIAVTYRDGFGIVGHITTSPDSITLSGARSLLDRLDAWKTVPLRYTDVNAPITASIPLSPLYRFEVTRPDTLITVRFDVQPIAERTITDIPIEVLQVPEQRRVVLIPPKVNIIVRSGVNNVANLSGGDFQAYIDYRSILLDTSGRMSVTVIGPDHVQIVQLDPPLIQYVVRK
ncbi:MAG: hypothetical protein HUU02_09955 [Bacteroidetes bacterium]|nr:hypothetical protein [Bacteroidota bacterium]